MMLDIIVQFLDIAISGLIGILVVLVAFGFITINVKYTKDDD